MRAALRPGPNEQGYVTTLDLRGVADPRADPHADFDPYYPLGPIAISPDGRWAWVHDEQRRAVRIDLDRGTHECFGFELRDAVYAADGRIIAVTALKEPGLVEFDDDNPTSHLPIPCPAPRLIHWPYAPPYRFAAYDLDWRHAALRLTATRWGVALAQVSGLLWVRFADGEQRAWTMPPVYQGWTCAYVHADGVVVSSVHNGRTGDVVWLDREGVWLDCYDSNWKSIGPCVPAPRGFLLGQDDSLLRFEGWPAQVCEQTTIGGRVEDASVDLDCEKAMIWFGKRTAIVTGRERKILVHVGFEREQDHEQFERVAEPSTQQPWRFTAIDDPELGRIWRPDPSRMQALISSLRDADDPATQLAQTEPGAPIPLDGPLEQLVFRRLQRWVDPELGRGALLRLLERLADAAQTDADPWLSWALRTGLPKPWRASEPSLPAAAWFEANVPKLFEGRFGEREIVRAQIGASLDRRPPWSLALTLDDGAAVEVTLEGLDPGALAGHPSELDDEIEMVEGDLLVAGQAPRRVVVSLDPLPGHLAIRVTVQAKAGGEALLQTAATVEPVALDDTRELDDLRRLALAAPSWPALWIGRIDGQLCASPYAADLEQPRQVEQPPASKAIRELVERLIFEELLELGGEYDDAFLWTVERAAYAGAEALEKLLLEHPLVEELYADLDQLAAYV